MDTVETDDLMVEFAARVYNTMKACDSQTLARFILHRAAADAGMDVDSLAQVILDRFIVSADSR